MFGAFFSRFKPKSSQNADHSGVQLSVSEKSATLHTGPRQSELEQYNQNINGSQRVQSLLEHQELLDQGVKVQAQDGPVFTSKQPVNGISVAAAVKDNGSGKIELIDHTERGEKTGTIRAYIDYAVGDKIIEIEHFEAQPAGFGLGTLLLYELAKKAVMADCRTITVQNPAISAIGAYVSFGGEPANKEAYDSEREMYAEAMRQNPAKHQSLVKTEAQEISGHAVSRARYFDQSLKPEDGERIHQETYQNHLDQNLPDDPNSVERIANALAISRQLQYDPSKLYKKMQEKLFEKWNFG